MDTSTIALNAMVVAILGGTVVPLLTALATKLEAQTGVKVAVGLVLSAVVTVLGTVIAGNGVFEPHASALLFLSALCTAAAAQFGWKAVGSGTVPGAKATADVGIG